MSKYIKSTIIFLICTVLCFGLAFFVNSAGVKVWLGLFGIAFLVLFLCFVAITFSKKRNKNMSPYRIFAIVDGLIGAGVLAYAVFDIVTDTGWFAGLVGVLLLIFVIPIILTLLLGDFLVWKFRKMRKRVTGRKQY